MSAAPVRHKRREAPDRPAVYTVEEAAAILRVSETTLRERLKDKDSGIPHVRMGRLIRIPATRFHQWLESIGLTP